MVSQNLVFGRAHTVDFDASLCTTNGFERELRILLNAFSRFAVSVCSRLS